MARWLVLKRIPDFPDRASAERWARLEYGPNLLEVVSVVEYEQVREERGARKRNRRLRGDAEED